LISTAATGNDTISAIIAGRTLVLYFYPRDNTAGCTKEALGFKEVLPALQAKGVDLLGVSKDSLKSHTNFISKHDLPFVLLSDPDTHSQGIRRVGF
jgi:peroxiredoxin Q/BCP